MTMMWSEKVKSMLGRYIFSRYASKKERGKCRKRSHKLTVKRPYK